jgi:8-amino-7-oxononanoate synthase
MRGSPLSDPFAWVQAELHDLDQRGLRRSLAERARAQRGDRIVVDGRELVNFGSNDYLGLADDPRLATAVRAAIDTHGWGAGASPLVTGRGDLHAKLERRLAEFEHTEAALLFPTGFAANVGTITALAGPGDAIFSDAKNHASIIDGCRLSGAAVHVYRHADAAHLKTLLEQTRGARRRLIVTDGLFSMDGDLAPLDAIAELAERHAAMLVVDEAHATGVFGATGRGACEHFHLSPTAAIRVGTLSKALGSIGGFVCGPQPIIDWLLNRARPYVFSTALPEATAAAALAALDIVEQEPQRRRELLDRAAALRQKLMAASFRIGLSQSQIVPILLGDPMRTMQAAAHLRAAGFFVPGIRPPSVPAGESLLRISLTWRHDEAMIERLLASLPAAT